MVEEIQKKYYQNTAEKYDVLHPHSDEDHARALKFVELFSRMHQIQSFLDIGCGTGRAVIELTKCGFDVTGLDASKALLDQAEAKKIPHEKLILGYAEQIPFKNKSFDAVCEFGVLHHVPRPHLVIQEMIRTARKAIFLSDSNRFGQGGYIEGIIKVLLYKFGLWRTANFIKTKGKGYLISEGDGLSYSYSVYDSYLELSQWADNIYLIPAETIRSSSWFSPLLSSSHILLAAIKDS